MRFSSVYNYWRFHFDCLEASNVRSEKLFGEGGGVGEERQNIFITKTITIQRIVFNYIFPSLLALISFQDFSNLAPIIFIRTVQSNPHFFLCFPRISEGFWTFYENFNPIPPGLFESGAAWGGGEGGEKVPTAYNSKTINDNEMKLGGVVKNH